MAEPSAYIGIGSNMGNPAEQVASAIALLDRLPKTRLMAQSDLYLSAPVDAGGDNFINAVACIRTALSPAELMEALHRLEQRFGRKRTGRNAPRTLDMDILLYGDLRMDSGQLVIPHPRMTGRAFVLVPLLQIAPEISIPGKGRASQFLDAVRDQSVTLFGK